MNSNDIQKQLAKLRRDKRLLWLGILFFVLVVLWILVSIFATSKTSSVSPELKNLAKSFVPRLESKLFDEILPKRNFSEEELSAFPIYIFDKKSSDKNSVGTAEMIDITLPSAAIEDANTQVDKNSDQTSNDQASSTATLDDSFAPDGQNSQLDVAEITAAEATDDAVVQ